MLVLSASLSLGWSGKTGAYKARKMKDSLAFLIAQPRPGGAWVRQLCQL